MDKNTLRQEMKKNRKTLSVALRKVKSGKIVTRLEKMEAFQKASTILVYVSAAEEVNTHALIKKYLHSKRIVIPRVLKNENSLALCQLKHWESLKEGHFGILEVPPEKAEYVKEESIELALVPGIAFDESGQRLGYGNGYYDRLLQKIKGLKVGLAYECQRVKKIPHKSHDVAVEKLVTEQKIYSFNAATPHEDKHGL